MAKKKRLKGFVTFLAWLVGLVVSLAIGGALIAGTLLLFIVYLYVIEHFNKMDRDIDEVVSLLQTKALVHNKKHK